MQRVIYVPPWEDVSNPGAGVSFELRSPYIIGSPQGTGGVEANILTAPTPLLSGAPVYNLTLADRIITFYIHIKGETREKMYSERKRLAGLLLPYNGTRWERPGRLYYQNDDGAYWIDAIPIGSPEYGDRIKNYNRAELKFQCPDPFWKSLKESYAELTYGKATFKFPFKFKPSVGFGKLGYNKEIVNTGQISAPILIKIRGTGVENPTIMNLRTNQFIRIVSPVPDGCELIINTSFWNRAVELLKPDGTRENAYRYIDTRSEFFHVLPGANTIKYDSDSINKDARVNITWRDHFAGV